MRKLKSLFLKFCGITALLIFPILSTFAQNPGYNMRIANAAQVSCNVYEFDVLLSSTQTANPVKLVNFQIGILVDPAIIPTGGVIDIALVPGSSTITNPAQQPGPEKFLYNPTTNCIQMAPVVPPGPANGVNVPTGAGFRLFRLRVGCTLPFVTGTNPNHTWNFVLATAYPTRLFAYIGTINTEITNPASHILVAPANPVFTGGFPDPVIQTVAGGGTICTLPGASGVSIGLSNSQPGYSYYLSRNGVQLPNVFVFGTGSNVNFPLQTVPGTYTVTSPSCTGNISMTGQAVIDTVHPVTSSVTISASPGNIVLPGTLVTYTANLVNAGALPYIIWSVNGVEDLVNGDGVSVYNYTPVNGDQVSCKMYPDPSLCTSTSVANSNVINMLVGICSDFTEVTNAGICQGGQYSWRGDIYTAAGTYYDSLVSILPPGCDSVYVLNLTVHPKYEFVTNASICSGGVYNWRGNNYSTAGTYTDPFLSQFGCDSIYKLSLIVNPVYEFVTNASICQGGFYTWRGNNYTAAGTYTDAFLSQLGCDSIYKLNLIVNPIYEFITNAAICDGSVYTWRGNNYTQAGNYIDVLTTQFGCDSIFRLNLSVNDVYTDITNEQICEGNFYTWRGTDYYVGGTYTETLSTQQGCDSTFILNLTVTNLPMVSISGLNILYCDYNPVVTMTGSPAGGIFSGTGVTGNQFNPSAAGLGTWTVTYSYTDGNGCSNSASVNVTVDACFSVESYDDGNLIIYPNPVNDKLTIEIYSAASSDHAWNLYDANGKMIMSGSQKLSSGINYLYIDTYHLANGFYMFQSQLNGSTQRARIIKQ